MKNSAEAVSTYVEGGVKSEEKEKAMEQFDKMFNDLNNKDQAGISTLLRKLIIRGFADSPLVKAFNSVELREDEFFTGPKGRDNRVDRLAWIINGENGFIGRSLTVSDARSLLEKKGVAG